jgi:hypothetical protein
MIGKSGGKVTATGEVILVKSLKRELPVGGNCLREFCKQMVQLSAGVNPG